MEIENSWNKKDKLNLIERKYNDNVVVHNVDMNQKTKDEFLLPISPQNKYKPTPVIKSSPPIGSTRLSGKQAQWHSHMEQQASYSPTDRKVNTVPTLVYHSVAQ